MNTCVVPTIWEGLGLVVLEVVVPRVPLVASSAGARPEIITPRSNDLLFNPPDDPRELAMSIGCVAEDAGLRKMMVQNYTEKPGQGRWHKTAARTFEAMQQVISSN